ncbi:MAG: MATE family efflux transporter [Treponema sp.]|nr:MATE family efflux transporter [Treponema sp.]
MDEKTDFTQGSIFKKLISFMSPIFGALVLQAMYGAVDVIIVGHFGTTEGISAVSTGSNILNFVVFTVAGLSMGITVLIGRYIGEKKTGRIPQVIGGAICFLSVIAVIIGILMLIFARQISMLLQAPEEALDLTCTYVRICGGGIFFIIAYNAISGIFRGMGDSKSPLIFVAIACVSNIIGDLILVAGFKLNVTGAAIATVFAQAQSVIISLIIIRKKKMPFKIQKSDIRFNSEIKRFVSIGSPIALQEILTQISFLALVAFINKLGLKASSGYGVANKIVGFVMLIPGSLLQSLAAFIAQNVGAGLEKRSQKAMLTGMASGSAVGFLIIAAIFLFGDRISSIFSEDPAVIERSWEYLKGFAAEAVLTSILFSFMGYFNGHSKTFFVMLQGISQTFLVRLPFSYIMSIQENPSLTMIGLAAPLATCFGIAVNLIYFFHCRRSFKKMPS